MASSPRSLFALSLILSAVYSAPNFSPHLWMQRTNSSSILVEPSA